MKPKSTLRSFLAMAGSSLLAVTYVSANTYYWDSNDVTPGFGAVNALWTGTTIGTATSGWSTDSTGSTVINGNSVTTNGGTPDFDAVFFGTNTTPYTGTITFSGPLSVKSIYACPTHGSFAAASSPVITFGAEGIFESAQGGTVGLPLVTFDGAATSLTIRSGRTVQLSNLTNNIPNTSKIVLESSADSPNLPLIGRIAITKDVLAPATGTITYGAPANGNTVTVNGTVLTKVAAAPVGPQFTNITELNALVTAIPGVDSTENGTVVSITAETAGPAGNAITLTKTGSALTLSAATLTGGSAPQLGPAGAGVQFNGGSLRFISPTLAYASLSALHAVHPVTFGVNKSIGFDNQCNGTTFTVDQSLNLGSGIFQSEGGSSGLIKLTQPNTWAELRLVAGTCEIDNLNQLGTAVRWGSSGAAGGNGTLRILGPITSFGAVTMLTTTDKGVGIEIADAGNTFTVDQQLAMGTGSFTKTGAGTLVLNHATASNTYTGGTTVSVGTLNVSNIPVAVSGLTSATNSGTLNLSGNNSASTGGVTLNGATAVLNLASTSALGTGTCTLQAGTLKNSVNTLSTTHPVTLSTGFTWEGINNLTFLNGAVSLPGSSTIVLGGTTSTLTFGGVLTNTQAGSPTLTVNGAGSSLVISGGYALSNSAINYTPVISGTGNVTITGAVTNGGTATASALTKTGTGTLTLNGNNTYDGLTTHSTAGSTLTLAGDNSGAAGGIILGNATAVLNVNSNTALGTGTLTLTAGTFNNTSGTPKSLSTNNLVVLNGNTSWGGANDLTFGNGDVQINASGRVITLTNSGALTFGGKLVNTLANNTIFSVSGLGKTMTAAGLACSNSVSPRTFTVQGDGNLTITGAVSGSSLGGSENIASGLTHSGTGTLTLQGTNTHTGLTSVTAAGTLAGNGNYAASVTIGATGTHRLAVAATAGTQDTSVITGTLTLTAGNILDLTAASTPADGVYVLATASVGITGTPTTVNYNGITGLVSVDTASTPKRLLLTVNAAPPTLTSIVDDQGGGPIAVNTLVTYTVTFSEDMDASTVTAADFSDAGGDVSLTIGTITETSPGVFTVQVTPTSAGTLNLQIPTSAVITDSLGGLLDNDPALVDDTNINVTVASGYASWKGANAGGQDPDVDFDNDGVDNGVEYFMNAVAGFTASPALDGTNTITWTNGGNILPGAYGTEYVIQTSSNLSTWTNVLVGDLTTNTAGPGGSLTYTLTGASPRFVRLKVTPN